jgi:hypothetical protein
VKRQDTRLVAVGTIAPAKRDTFTIEGQQARIQDSYAMDVAAQITQDLQGTALRKAVMIWLVRIGAERCSLT